MREQPVAHDIHHETGADRFSAGQEDQRAVLDYRRQGDTMVITHTFVPDALRGQGLAGRLVQAAVSHARAAGLKVLGQCSYAAHWLDEHPEYADLRA